MGETFWGSVISGGVAIIVCLITQLSTKTLIAYRLEKLEEKVDKHNNLIERTYKLEEQTVLLDQRVDQLEAKR